MVYMTRTRIRELVEAAFDSDALEEAIIEKIGDFIDYDDVAERLLRRWEDEISDAALEFADDWA